MSVTASGSPVCTVSLADTTVTGVRDGDVLQIQISIDLHAPGWFDEADVYLWFAGQPQEHGATTDSYSGTLTIQRTVSPNQIYNYYAQGIGYDWGSYTCNVTYEQQLFTYP